MVGVSSSQYEGQKTQGISPTFQISGSVSLHTTGHNYFQENNSLSRTILRIKESYH